MSYAIVHMQKIKIGAVRGIQSHNNREYESKTNQDIDYTRSEQNIDLIPCSNYSAKIKKIIKEKATGTKTVRKDAVTLCSFIITSDHDTMLAMDLATRKKFFEDSLKWFSERYGADLIVSATVHNDEHTPHLHLGLVPVIDNRLTAKKFFTPVELKKLQTDFAEEVGKNYGLERGREGSTAKHLSEVDFKLQTKQKEFNDLSDLETLKNAEIENLELRKASLVRDLGSLSQKLKDLAADIHNLPYFIAEYQNRLSPETINILSEMQLSTSGTSVDQPKFSATKSKNTYENTFNFDYEIDNRDR